MSEGKTITLEVPVQLGDTQITELTFREPNAKDMRHLPVNQDKPMATVLWLAGRLCGQTDAVIEKLSWPDLQEVMRIAQGFMPQLQETGSDE